MQQPPLGALHPTAWPRLEKRGKAGETLRLPPKHHAALRQATLRLHIALSATLPVGLPRTTETRGTRRDNGTRARADTGRRARPELATRRRTNRGWPIMILEVGTGGARGGASEPPDATSAANLQLLPRPLLSTPEALIAAEARAAHAPLASERIPKSRGATAAVPYLPSRGADGERQGAVRKPF